MTWRGVNLRLVVLLSLGVSGTAIGGDEGTPAPSVRAHPALDVGPTPPIGAAVVRQVEALVGRLHGIRRRPAAVQAWTSAGPTFEPRERSAEADSREADAAEAAYQALAVLGPAAMPALLAHLDDPTPTGWVVDFRGSPFGSMWLSSEVGVNAALPEEESAVREALGTPEGPLPAPDTVSFDERRRPVARHVMTVGDLCFDLLGIVVNRPYEAGRGQPTMCEVVNSPTSDPRIARAVRAQWQGRDLRRALAARLDQDLWTSGPPWLSNGALFALLAWFPGTVDGQVVRLLDGIEPVESASGPANVWTGVDPVVLVSRVRTMDPPGARDALVRLVGRARNPAVVRAALKGLPDLKDDALHDHLLSVLDGAVARVDVTDDAAGLLLEIEARWPARYPAALRRLLRGHGIEGVHVVLELAYERGVPLPVEVWRPLLDVRAVATENRYHPPGPSARLERLRVCDAAAHLIAGLRPDLPFDEDADVAERERRIQAMRSALDAAPRNAPEDGK